MDTPQKAKKSKKKIAVIVLSVICLSAVAYIATLYNTKNKGEITVGAMSGRSKEFLKKQQAAPESDLFAAQLNATPDTSNSKQYPGGDCFTLKSGVKVVNTQQSKPCGVTLFTEQPRMTIVAFMQEGSFASLEDDAGVKMRKLNTDLYTEKSQEINGQKYTIFRLKDESKYESSAFTLVNGSLFAVSITSNTNENLDPRLISVITSVEFK